jgi:hypothetical protein
MSLSYFCSNYFLWFNIGFVWDKGCIILFTLFDRICKLFYLLFRICFIFLSEFDFTIDDFKVFFSDYLGFVCVSFKRSLIGLLVCNEERSLEKIEEELDLETLLFEKFLNILTVRYYLWIKSNTKSYTLLNIK